MGCPGVVGPIPQPVSMGVAVTTMPNEPCDVNTLILIERYIVVAIESTRCALPLAHARLANRCGSMQALACHCPCMHPIKSPQRFANPVHRTMLAASALRAAMCGWLLLAGIGDAAASNVYRWVDAHGVSHYADRAPQGQAATRVQASVIPARADVSAVARLQVESDGSHYNAVVINTLSGPIEVALTVVDGSNFTATPPLPLRALLKPLASQTLSIVSLADPTHAGGFQLQLSAVPGDPKARPESVTYLLPVDTRSWRIDQGWHGSFSHNDAQSGYAIDISVDEGTPVLAARGGVVMQVESDFDKAGLNREKYAERANVIRIVHDDGSMAVYAHLKRDGELVRPGQHVATGQRIGYSGNTGFTTGPHLHFAVQVNRGMDLESIPFVMTGPSGAVPIPGAH
jgi:murein DD-endopeptidase MepM/ murein hydrolase activator NlpD